MKIKKITKYWSISDKQKKKLDLIKNKEKSRTKRKRKEGIMLKIKEYIYFPGEDGKTIDRRRVDLKELSEDK